jgi:hypothetical protein
LNLKNQQPATSNLTTTPHHTTPYPPSIESPLFRS